MEIDHVVLYAKDPAASAEFYGRVVGLPAERVEEYRAGMVSFPSVRVSPHSVIDLMGSGDGPHPTLNHICLAMSEEELNALRARLAEHHVPIVATMSDSFGARGTAPHTFYFEDPDGNVIEARYYSHP
jgi:catechol 2,3-dioxygenase-like lactoylglutathione lyase family enzyme